MAARWIDRPGLTATWPSIRTLAARVWRRAGALLALLVVVGGIAAPIAAAARADQSDIEDEVMCVQCGRPLSTSGGRAADDQRQLIEGWIAEGLTKAQIKERLVAEYGDRVLVKDQSPIAAAAPWMAGVVGAASVTLLLLRRRQRDGLAAGDHNAGAAHHRAEAAAPPPISAADQARIDAELEERG